MSVNKRNKPRRGGRLIRKDNNFYQPKTAPIWKYEDVAPYIQPIDQGNDLFEHGQCANPGGAAYFECGVHPIYGHETCCASSMCVPCPREYGAQFAK